MNGLYPYTFINKSGETMPAFGIMKLNDSGNVTVGKRLFAGVTKPDGDPGLYFINSPVSVEDDAYGHAATGVLPCWVKYSGSPSQGGYVGPSDDDWTVSPDGEPMFYVLHVDATNGLVYAQQAEICPYFWEFYIEAGTADPTSGTAIFNVTIDADSQDVTIPYNMTAAQMTTELLAEFTGLSADDIECTGGPLPTIPIDVEWKTKTLQPDWPPTVGASTLNNSAVCKVRQRNPR